MMFVIAILGLSLVAYLNRMTPKERYYWEHPEEDKQRNRCKFGMR